MNCVFCGCDPDVVCVVPAPDGSCEVFACRSCAIARGVYCTVHEECHTGFLSGGTACLRCIEEAVRCREDQASRIFGLLILTLPEEEIQRLREWADLAGSLMGDAAEAVTVLRAILTVSHRRKVSPEKVIAELVGAQSVTEILPTPF